MLKQIMLNCLYRAKSWDDYIMIGVNMRMYRKDNLIFS